MDISYLRDILHYDEDTGKLYWRENSHKSNTWNLRYPDEEAFTCIAASGYLVGKIDGKQYRAHRIAFAIYHGYWPDEIDHIDRDKINNRIDNLRDCSRSENNLNRKFRWDKLNAV